MGKAEHLLKEAIGNGVVVAFQEAITGTAGTTNFPLPSTGKKKLKLVRGGKPPKNSKQSKKQTSNSGSTGATETGASLPSKNFPLPKAPKIPVAPGSATGASSGGGGGGSIGNRVTQSYITFVELDEGQRLLESFSAGGADGAGGISLYNAHGRAAQSSSAKAFSSGSADDHAVASAHHGLAASAAQNAAGQAPKLAANLNTAANYHKTQAAAHDAATKSITSGNSLSSYSY